MIAGKTILFFFHWGFAAEPFWLSSIGHVVHAKRISVKITTKKVPARIMLAAAQESKTILCRAVILTILPTVLHP